MDLSSLEKARTSLGAMDKEEKGELLVDSIVRVAFLALAAKPVWNGVVWVGAAVEKTLS